MLQWQASKLTSIFTSVLEILDRKVNYFYLFFNSRRNIPPFFGKHSKSILSVAQCVPLGERRNGLARFLNKRADEQKWHTWYLHTTSEYLFSFLWRQSPQTFKPSFETLCEIFSKFHIKLIILNRNSPEEVAYFPVSLLFVSYLFYASAGIR